MTQTISIIIPAYNAGRTIGKCLASVFAFGGGCEVVVVDDCSGDGSAAIVEKFPCALVRLPVRRGASAARNAGALRSSGEVLFFIDADCLLQEDTLDRVRENLRRHPAGVVIGGTYAPEPFDPGFFNRFQSLFINYSETKQSASPDYVATHAMAVHAETFRAAGGFREDFQPLLEDVEFSHRLRRKGLRLVIDPGLRVRHIFGFTLGTSLRNAVRKSRSWIAYSLANRDLFADSGAASREIKANGAVWLATVFFLCLPLLSAAGLPRTALVLLWAADLLVNRRLLRSFFAARGAGFGAAAALYYLAVYPAAVWTGAFLGAADFLKGANRKAA